MSKQTDLEVVQLVSEITSMFKRKGAVNEVFIELLEMLEDGKISLYEVLHFLNTLKKLINEKSK